MLEPERPCLRVGKKAEEKRSYNEGTTVHWEENAPPVLFIIFFMCVYTQKPLILKAQLDQHKPTLRSDSVRP